jgi:prepilin-type processing-associated H-X9-DG protein
LADYPSAYYAVGTSYQTNLFLVGANKYGPFSDRTAELDARISAGITSMNVSKVSVSCSRLVLMGDWGWVAQWDPGYPDNGPAWHGRKDTYMMAFLDGHVSFTQIVKGDYSTDAYTVVPFKGLSGPQD